MGLPPSCLGTHIRAIKEVGSELQWQRGHREGPKWEMHLLGIKALIEKQIHCFNTHVTNIIKISYSRLKLIYSNKKLLDVKSMKSVSI